MRPCARKQRDLELSKAQAETDRVKEESEAAKRVIQARGEAEAAKYSAQALSAREKSPQSGVDAPGGHGEGLRGAQGARWDGVPTS